MAEFYGQTALICPFLLGYVCLPEGNKGGLGEGKKKVYLPERKELVHRVEKDLSA